MKKIKFELRQTPNTGGLVAIIVFCHQNNRHVEIDTNVRVFKDEWDHVNGLISDNPNSKKLNKLIRQVIYQLEEIELDYGDGFTIHMLKEMWDCRTATHDFYAFMEGHIKNRTDIRINTRGIHQRVLSHLKNYRNECFLCDVTEEYSRSFFEHLKNYGLSTTTASMHIRVLKSYYEIARRRFGDKLPACSFDWYHPSEHEKFEYRIKHLNDDEVRMLEKYIATPGRKEHDIDTINQFLFMSYTGVRSGDFKNITEKNITQESDGMWLTYTSIKTDTRTRVPLYAIFDGKAELLLTKYQDRLKYFFTLKTHFNQRITSLAKKAGVQKHVTAHVARHTCASRLINKEIPLTTVQKIIGHRNYKMTMLYANTNESTIVRQLQR